MLVERNETSRPAIGKALPVEIIEDPWRGRCGKAQHSERAQVRIPKHGFEPACEGIVCQHGVEEDRKVGCAYAMSVRRDAGVEIGEGLIIGKFGDFGEAAGQEVEGAGASVFKGGQSVSPVGGLLAVGAFDQEAFGLARSVFWREPEQGEIKRALERRAGGLEHLTPLHVDDPGGRISKVAIGIIRHRRAHGLEEKSPARTEATKHIVHPRHGRDEFGIGRAFKVRPAIAVGLLETAILVEDHARRDKAGPGQIVSQKARLGLVFSQVQHERCSL